MGVDSLDKLWCCLTCNWKGRVGEMLLGQADADGFLCPKCRSSNTFPADGGSYDVPEYVDDGVRTLN